VLKNVLKRVPQEKKNNVGACAAAPPASRAAAAHRETEKRKRKQFIQLFDRNFCFQSETFSRKNIALNYSGRCRNWMRVSEFCCDVQSFKNSIVFSTEKLKSTPFLLEKQIWESASSSKVSIHYQKICFTKHFEIFIKNFNEELI